MIYAFNNPSVILGLTSRSSKVKGFVRNVPILDALANLRSAVSWVNLGLGMYILNKFLFEELQVVQGNGG